MMRLFGMSETSEVKIRSLCAIISVTGAITIENVRVFSLPSVCLCVCVCALVQQTECVEKKRERGRERERERVVRRPL